MGGDGQGTQGSSRLGRRQKEQDHMGGEIFLNTVSVRKSKHRRASRHRKGKENTLRGIELS